ncbi:MAG TPA: TetR/AcrR family transcriptional regulator [Kofleriaceae bacterium]|jgi:AcrR family transcriptional regulator
MARPREFDIDAALDGAMRIFWRNGYAGTSMDDLTTELGIVKPSLYNAFGNKRQLFDQALERYATRSRAKLDDAIAEPTAARVAARYLHSLINTTPGVPPSCMMVKGAMDCSPGSADVQQAIASRLRHSEKLLAFRFARARDEGDLPDDANPADLARFVMAMSYGIAAQSSVGATAAQLRRVADVAVNALSKV